MLVEGNRAIVVDEGAGSDDTDVEAAWTSEPATPVELPQPTATIANRIRPESAHPPGTRRERMCFRRSHGLISSR